MVGCLLFNITTQRLTRELREQEGDNRPAPLRYFPGDSSDEDSVNFWDEDGAERRLATFLYVDDTTLIDKVPLT